MESIKRKYNVSDLYMLEFSKTMRTHFMDEQAAFSGFDADFTSPFETDWLSKIEAAEAILPDEAIKDQLNQLTADVELAMEQCRRKFQVSKYFIDKAFEKSAAIRNEFGYNDYTRNRLGQLTLLQFMQTFFKTATKYAAELAAVGFDAAAVSEIELLAKGLNDANIAQEKFKGTRQLITEDRIAQHNKVWNVTLKVSRAGKIIFFDDPAKYQLFLLPASNESGDDISISGTVSAQGGAAIEGALVSIASLSIETETDSNGNYVFGNLDEGSYTVSFSADGFAPAEFGNVQVADGQTTELDVSLNPSSVNTSITGTVTDATTLLPIQNAEVRFITGDGATNTLTGSNGQYLLDLSGLTGTVNGNLQFAASGYTTDSRALTIVEGNALIENFSLTSEP
ncbi:MAG: carboxypeptidase regulatory-like domain-containing protein [Flavobacteriales bacterium]|nr:carboxypeptidase regulatory-like domain-containing protein [Flavobacteriales bacterium]MCB9192838.1 carboxypeptidase regulatory-like domain-containing protein [Flavobacteriales bacterium]